MKVRQANKITNGLLDRKNLRRNTPTARNALNVCGRRGRYRKHGPYGPLMRALRIPWYRDGEDINEFARDAMDLRMPIWNVSERRLRQSLLKQEGLDDWMECGSNARRQGI